MRTALHGFILAAAMLLPVTTEAARGLRLSWEGVPGAEYYELEVGATRIRVDSPVSQVDAPGATGSRARIRAVYPDKTSSRWVPLRFVEWAAPKLPQRIRVASDEAGSKVARWLPPPGPLSDQRISYHVRIAGYQDGIVLHEGIVPEAEFTLPRLPGGDYVLTVSAAGAPETGTLSPEDSPSASSLIEAEAIEFDTGIAAPDVLALTDPFAPGFISRSFLELHAGGPARQVLLQQQLGYNWGTGFGVSVGLPVVLSEIGSVPVGSTVPRIGGIPFPTLAAGVRFLGGPRDHLFAGVVATLPLDSSGANDEQPFQVQGVLGGRATFGKLGLDASLAAGSTFAEYFSGIETRSFPVIGATLAPYLVPSPVFRVGLAVSLGQRGEIVRVTDGAIDSEVTPAETSLSAQAFADLAVSEHAYLKGGVALLSPGVDRDSEVSFVTGVGIVF